MLLFFMDYKTRTEGHTNRRFRALRVIRIKYDDMKTKERGGNMDIERLTPAQKKRVIDHFETMILAEIDSNSVLSQVKGERKDLLLIDVRDPKSFADGHVPGAVNLPLAEVENKFRQLPKDKLLVVYCWSAECLLAPRAALKMTQLELFPKIMRTGWSEWVATKKPVERKEMFGGK